MSTQDAQFRSAKFLCDSDERQGGRAGVIHEYPYSEAPPFSEDNGMRARRFTIEGYVIGANYARDRDALISELETPGPGELLHPKFGPRRVMALSYRVREERGRQRVAYFSIEFAETSTEPSKPTATPDAPTALAVSIGVAKTATGNQFMSAYASYIAYRQKIADNLRKASLAIEKVLGTVALEIQANASLRRRLAILRSDTLALANAPADILSSFVGLFDELETSVAAVAAFEPSAAFLSIYNYDPGTEPIGTTPSRIAERESFRALHALVQRYALISAANAAIGQTFDSFDAAVERRNAIATLIDEHLESASDDTYQSLFELRSALVLAVPGPDSDLPRLQTLTLNSTTPSLVLTHRLYGSVTLEADVIARNKIRNPGFIPGGTVLQVLSRG